MVNRSWSIRRAKGEEAASTLAILREAATWSLCYGDPIWPFESFSLEEERALAAKGEQIAGFEGTAMVACMRLQRREPVHWPDAADGEALYLHKLAVCRASSGKGWTDRMVDWAVEECRWRGVGALRLDTRPGTKLVALYERLGFRLVDEAPQQIAQRMIVRMERALGPSRRGLGQTKP